jgi:hypothetical protein
MGERRNAFRDLFGKPKGKVPLGRPRCRWEDNIKMYFRVIGWSSMEWIHLAEDRDQWIALVNMVMNLWVSSNFGEFWNSCTTGSFSRT